MNKTLIGSFVGLLLGAAAGGFAGYFYGKNKYLAIAEKEIDSVKKVYEKHCADTTVVNCEEQTDTTAKISTRIASPLIESDK